MWLGLELLLGEPLEREPLERKLIGEEVNGRSPTESLCVAARRRGHVQLERGEAGGPAEQPAEHEFAGGGKAVRASPAVQIGFSQTGHAENEPDDGEGTVDHLSRSLFRGHGVFLCGHRVAVGERTGCVVLSP